jgi:hypothetical protein
VTFEVLIVMDDADSLCSPTDCPTLLAPAAVSTAELPVGRLNPTFEIETG